MRGAFGDEARTSSVTYLERARTIAIGEERGGLMLVSLIDGSVLYSARVALSAVRAVTYQVCVLNLIIFL